ncbi:MAG: helix-turn-helix transcriptional regulator [Xanthobacteraceae bacterium]
MNDVPLPVNDLVLRDERRRLVPLSDSTVWRMERRGEFPRRIPISDKRVAWRRSEIARWLAGREVARTREGCPQVRHVASAEPGRV